jgi:ParB-like chromosome segregation protein Spo0J
MEVQLVPTEKVVANEYNPNYVAESEMELLRISIEEDGLTQPIVVFYDEEKDLYIVVDGFHRYVIVRDYFESDVIPVVVIDKPIEERMASTMRHNRARGKHQVDLTAELVKKLLRLGKTDDEIAHKLGMSAEEVLRLKQQVRVANVMANAYYTQSWEVVDGDVEVRE